MSFDLNLSGRTALITGASRGIGRAIAHAFAEQGCDLHLASRTESDLRKAEDEIRSRFNVKVTIHPSDLADGEACRRLAAASGDVDVLVNNAGAIPSGDLLSIDEDRWRKAWDLKVFGFINLSRAVYAGMMTRKRGVIVNIMGGAGERPDAAFIVGSAGNAGLAAFTRALGGRSLDDGIRVVGINPGMVATERMQTLLEDRAEKTHGDRSRWQEFTAALPLGRGGKPSEVADAVLFLSSDRASYISGTVLTIDGGATNRR
jgi:NAD(P)-dependent dehydrogenase (short-subunit alcohol dehydrogenase family)